MTVAMEPEVCVITDCTFQLGLCAALVDPRQTFDVEVRGLEDANTVLHLQARGLALLDHSELGEHGRDTYVLVCIDAERGPCLIEVPSTDLVYNRLTGCKLAFYDDVEYIQEHFKVKLD